MSTVKEASTSRMRVERERPTRPGRRGEEEKTATAGAGYVWFFDENSTPLSASNSSND